MLCAFQSGQADSGQRFKFLYHDRLSVISLSELVQVCLKYWGLILFVSILGWVFWLLFLCFFLLFFFFILMADLLQVDSQTVSVFNFMSVLYSVSLNKLKNQSCVQL